MINRIRLTMLVVFAMVVPFSSAVSAAEFLPESTAVTNLSVAVGSVAVGDELVAFRVLEWAENGIDLNGDGDANDGVLHVLDRSTGLTINTGLAAIGDVFVEGELVVFRVWEFEQGGIDLNGNGNIFDSVLHVWERATGASLNLGLVTGWPFTVGLAVTSSGLAARASESAQGQDLNGDGDSFDRVIQIWQPGDAVAVNLGVQAEPRIESDGHLFVFQVDEFSQGGTDLNSDGDASDRILHVWDGSSLINLEWSTYPDSGLFGASFVADEGVIAAAVVEHDQAMIDLNGDGDTDDGVLHVWNADSGVTHNLGLATYTAFGVSGGVAAVAVTEYSQGSADLNADGDIQDSVLHFASLDGLQVTNTGLAYASSEGPPTVEGFVPFRVSEWDQGEDLNGSGDINGAVLHVWDIEAGTALNVGLHAGPIIVDDDLIIFSVNESLQAGDLNNDLDQNDAVMHAWSETDGIRNLGLAVTYGHSLENGFAAFAVPEWGQGGTDLNGDGDVGDAVLHVWEASTGQSTNVALSADFGFDLDVGVIAVAVYEGFQGGVDLNGDGDASDSVLHLVTLASTSPVSLDDLAAAIGVLEASDLKAVGSRKALAGPITAVEFLMIAGRVDQASTVLENLRAHLDGCGVEPDLDDWVVDCSTQIELRLLIDEILAAF